MEELLKQFNSLVCAWEKRNKNELFVKKWNENDLLE